MKWNDETWSNGDTEVHLVRADEDGGVIVNGSRREVSAGELYEPSGSDTAGVFTVSEDDLREAGFSADSAKNDGDSEKVREVPKRAPARKRS